MSGVGNVILGVRTGTPYPGNKVATTVWYSPWTTYFSDGQDPYGVWTGVVGPYGYTAVGGFVDFANVNGAGWGQLPSAGWCPHVVSITNNNPIGQKINIGHTSYMGMCGGANAILYRVTGGNVALGTTYMPTPPDWSIQEWSGMWQDTIPANTTYQYRMYYHTTFTHGVDRDKYGYGFRAFNWSHAGWV